MGKAHPPPGHQQGHGVSSPAAQALLVLCALSPFLPAHVASHGGDDLLLEDHSLTSSVLTKPSALLREGKEAVPALNARLDTSSVGLGGTENGGDWLGRNFQLGIQHFGPLLSSELFRTGPRLIQIQIIEGSQMHMQFIVFMYFYNSGATARGKK